MTTSCGTAKVAMGARGATGHVAAAPRGSVAHVPAGPRVQQPAPVISGGGISSDEGNILTLGNDNKAFLDCDAVETCLDGLYESAGAVAAHVAEANPHTQYHLSGARIIGREFLF